VICESVVGLIIRWADLLLRLLLLVLPLPLPLPAAIADRQCR